jgi:hypothetical protein
VLTNINKKLGQKAADKKPKRRQISFVNIDLSNSESAKRMIAQVVEAFW